MNGGVDASVSHKKMDDKPPRNPSDPEGQPQRRPFARGPERVSHSDRPYGRSFPPRRGDQASRSSRGASDSRVDRDNIGNRLDSDGHRYGRGQSGERRSVGFRNNPFGRPRHEVEEPVKKPRIVSDNQITEGKYMGEKITQVDLPKFKATSRRLREVFFRILGKKIRGRRFLDLRCGVGTMGIEALSRGAGLVTFVDRSSRMIECTKKNLEIFDIRQGHAELVEIEAIPFLKRTEKAKRKWDVLFVGMPLEDDSAEMLEFFKRGVAVTKGSALVLEHASSLSLPERTGRLRRRKIVVQGDVTMTFYEFR